MSEKQPFNIMKKMLDEFEEKFGSDTGIHSGQRNTDKDGELLPHSSIDDIDPVSLRDGDPEKDKAEFEKDIKDRALGKDADFSEAKTGKIDIGDGLILTKVGMDPNGNFSYWVKVDGKNKKFQAINLGKQGSPKIADIKDFKNPGKEAKKVIQLIKAEV